MMITGVSLKDDGKDSWECHVQALADISKQDGGNDLRDD
uniref:Uncharacterized protein n=1 Tax=Oryza punctata TaxID=4537 RepID=A0A0E0K684_ORYPU